MRRVKICRLLCRRRFTVDGKQPNSGVIASQFDIAVAHIEFHATDGRAKGALAGRVDKIVTCLFVEELHPRFHITHLNFAFVGPSHKNQ